MADTDSSLLLKRKPEEVFNVLAACKDPGSLFVAIGWKAGRFTRRDLPFLKKHQQKAGEAGVWTPHRKCRGASGPACSTSLGNVRDVRGRSLRLGWQRKSGPHSPPVRISKETLASPESSMRNTYLCPVQSVSTLRMPSLLKAPPAEAGRHWNTQYLSSLWCPWLWAAGWSHLSNKICEGFCLLFSLWDRILLYSSSWLFIAPAKQVSNSELPTQLPLCVLTCLGLREQLLMLFKI